MLTEEEVLITNFSLVVTPFKREESHSPNLNGCIHHLHHQHTIHSSFVLGSPCCTLKCSFCIWQGKTSLRINYVQLPVNSSSLEFLEFLFRYCLTGGGFYHLMYSLCQCTLPCIMTSERVRGGPAKGTTNLPYKVVKN